MEEAVTVFNTVLVSKRNILSHSGISKITAGKEGKRFKSFKSGYLKRLDFLSFFLNIPSSFFQIAGFQTA